MTAPFRGARSTILAMAWALASAGLAYAVQPYVQHSDLEMIHLLVIVLIALRFGMRDTLIACTVSIVSFDFLFIPPHFAFALTDAKSALVFIAMFVVAAVISTLVDRMRRQEQRARAAAFQAEALYGLNVELAGLTDARQLAAVTVRHLERLFDARAVVLLRGPEGGFDGADPRDVEPAERAWMRREYTLVDTPGAKAIWLPVAGIHAPLGVVGIVPPEPFPKDSEKGFLLIACVNQLATAAERVLLANAVRRTELESETERLRNSLLSAVSHDLKTPLAGMIAAATTLLRRHRTLDNETVEALLTDIASEGERLNELILNLLSITRLESPTIVLRRTPQAVDEVVAEAVARFEKRGGSPNVRVHVDPDLPLVSAEPVLLQQLLSNLLENGVRHAGSESNLEIRATAAAGSVIVQVADDGPGIPEQEREKVFEKFYRAAGSRDGGAGLGLTICRAIVQAHGGKIAARSRTGGGALIEFSVPAMVETGAASLAEASTREDAVNA